MDYEKHLLQARDFAVITLPDWINRAINSKHLLCLVLKWKYYDEDVSMREAIKLAIKTKLYRTVEEIRDIATAISGRYYSVETVGRELRKLRELGLAEDIWFKNEETKSRYKKWRGV